MQIFLAVAGFAILWFWWSSSGAKELATLTAKRTCKEAGLQFLDETVELKKIRLQRNEAGSISFARLYSFEFSLTGSHRNYGYIVTLGNKIYTVELEEPNSDDDNSTIH